MKRCFNNRDCFIISVLFIVISIFVSCAQGVVFPKIDLRPGVSQEEVLSAFGKPMHVKHFEKGEEIYEYWTYPSVVIYRGRLQGEGFGSYDGLTRLIFKDGRLERIVNLW